jgi:hypothetical protein
VRASRSAASEVGSSRSTGTVLLRGGVARTLPAAASCEDRAVKIELAARGGAAGGRSAWRPGRCSPRRSGYTTAGYAPIEAFGAYVGDPDAEDSLFFERVLGTR